MTSIISDSDVHWEIAGLLPALRGHRRSTVGPDQLQMARDCMEQAGVVLFRDFDLSIDGFRAVTKQLGSSYSTEKWTPHTTEPRGPYIGLHTEQAHLPVIPSALWFYSAEPARRGGATIVCDGAAVVRQLSTSTRRFLEQNDVLYWRRVSGAPPLHNDPQRVGDPPGLERNYRANAPVVHETHYETTALCRPLIYSRVGRLRVFGNHILNTAMHQEQDQPPEIDGFHQARMPTRRRLPHELLEELEMVTSKLLLKFKLGEREFVWIDNTRFMHGRTSFEGARRILALKAFHGDQWLPGCSPSGASAGRGATHASETRDNHA